MTHSTDPTRRLAAQLAIQLPADLAEARQVLALTGELLEHFLVEPSPAQRRARLLGWGGDRAPTAECLARRGRPFALALAALALALPLGWLGVTLFGAGGSVPLLLAGLVVALLLGTWPALLLAALSPLLFNLVIVPPALAFNRPGASDYIMALLCLIQALLVPWLVARRERLRARVLPLPPPAAAIEPATAKVIRL